MQYLFEYQAEVVVIMPDFDGAWFPVMQHGCLETMMIADPGEQSVFVRDHHLRGEQPTFVYHQWGMMPARLDDFANEKIKKVLFVILHCMRVEQPAGWLRPMVDEGGCSSFHISTCSLSRNTNHHPFSLEVYILYAP